MKIADYRDHMTLLKDLNQQVTLAIFRAERCPRGEERRQAWLEVARIEGLIADQTDPTTVQGLASRHGAVLALMKAVEPQKALALRNRYWDGADDHLRGLLASVTIADACDCGSGLPRNVCGDCDPPTR